MANIPFLNNAYFSAKVGIGTAATDYSLEVVDQTAYGGIFIVGGNAPGLTIRDQSSTSESKIYVQSVASPGSSGNLRISADDNSTALNPTIEFIIADSEKMRITDAGAIRFNSYTAGTLVTDSSGNITATTTPPGTGVFVPLAGGAAVGEKMTGTLYGTSTNMSGAGTYAGSMTLGNAAAAAEAHLTIGQGRTGNGYSYIDLVGDATYTDYGFRMIRGNGGANTTSELVHRGTGNFSLVSSDGGDIVLIPNAGNVGIGTTTPGADLDVRNNAGGTVRIGTDTDNIGQDTAFGTLEFYNGDTSNSGPGVTATIQAKTYNQYSTGGDITFSNKIYPSDTIAERMRIDSDGNVGIGITAPTSKLHINQNVTNPALDLPASFAVEIDSNHSGSAATTGDREQGGLFIDVDSSTTGGDTSDEHRVYGVYSDVKHSGDADRATGVYSLVEQNTTAGSTAYVLGGEFVAVTDGGASAAVNTVAGVWGSCSIQDATPLINSYGGYFRNSQAVNRTGATTSTYGLYTEVELNSDSAYTNIYGQRITIDVNTDAFTASSIIGLDFSFTGETDIPAATEVFAIRQPKDIRSYFQGDFGIGTATPKSKLQVAGGIQMADDTDAATINKVGTMRYRTGTEYVDVTGAEKVINGDFTTDADWNKNTNWTISGGTANADGTSNADINQIPDGGYPAIGEIFRIRFEITARTQGQVRVGFGGVATGFVEDVKQYEYIVTAVSTDRTRIQCSNSFIGSVDNVSIVQVIAEDASYADMCMQTGSSTYEWVNIVRNTY